MSAVATKDRLIDRYGCCGVDSYPDTRDISATAATAAAAAARVSSTYQLKIAQENESTVYTGRQAQAR